MTRLKYIIAGVFCLMLIGFTSKAQNITNKGKDFWVGYGHHQFMESGGDNSQAMTLYLSAEDQTATVWVTIDSSGVGGVLSTWWRRRFIIPPNTVISLETTNASGGLNVGYTSSAGQVGQIPKATGGTYDARLITDAPPAGSGGAGLFRKKGIHIESDVPIVAYAHIYGSASSGATMLLPTEAWGYSYISLNSFQSYASNCYNWMYVIAKNDNTVIEITPSVKTRGQNYTGLQQGVAKQITLMKGQIYQVIGANTGSDANGNGGGASTGLNLSGTKVRSVANGSGQCYPIAVFAGSSRTANPASCGSGGGDNDNQQLFPMHAWGKRYLTTPFSGSTSASSYSTCTYKIAVKDPTTVVRRNGNVITGLQNNNFYVYESNTPDYIEADKPIMVVQYMTGGGCLGTGGLGDPEMVVLSPMEQAIKRTAFYRNNKESITTNYLAITIPTAGLATLTIDGSSSFTYSAAHPRLAGYSIVIQRWSAGAGQSIAKSDSSFTGIVYGLGSVESYGYNAGTNLNNLSAISSVRNTPDTTTAVKTHPWGYVGTPTQISALISYKPTKIVWKFSALTPTGFISPVTTPDPVVNNPVPYDSVLIGAAWFYYYLCPGGPYTFSQANTYYLPVRLTSPIPDVGDCNNEEEISLEIIIKQKPFANFSYNIRGCGRDTITFTGPVTSTNGFNVKRWSWLLSNGQTSTSKDTSFVLDPGNYSMKLTIIVDHGGMADTTINFVNPAKPVVGFNINPNPACPGPVTFSTTTTYNGSTPITNWYWDLSSGGVVNAPNANNQVVTFPVGTYTIKHAVRVNNFCISDTLPKTLNVQAGAMIDFTYPQTCIPTTGVAQFTSNATNQPGITYTWTFGDPSSGANNTSSLQNPTHTYANNGVYNVRLQIATASCSGDTTFEVTIRKRAVLNYPGPLPDICRNASPVSVAVATHDTATGAGYYYSVKGAASSAGMFDPAIAGIGKDTIWYVFTTSAGCKDSIWQTINVNAGAAKPVAVTPVTYCQNATATALSATALPGNTLKWYNNPSLTGGSTTAIVPSTTTAGTFHYFVTQVPGSGCESDSTDITVIITPSVSNNIVNASQTICEGTLPNQLVPGATIGGGINTYTYQWESSVTPGVWNPISGAVSDSYAPPTLSVTTYYRRVATSGLCSSTSNVDTITVVPQITNNTITGDQTICEGSPIALIDGTAGSSGYVYSWEFSTDNGSTWNTVSSAAGEDYQPSNLSLTTKYRRLIVNGPCASTSNIVTVTVNPVAAGTISGTSAICQYDSAKVKFVATAGTAPFTVYLSITNPASVTTQKTVSISSGDSILVIPVNSAAGTYTIKLDSIANSNNCITKTGLNTLSITVTATPVVTLNVSPSNSVCAGTTVTLTAGGATNYTWTGTGLSATTGSTVTTTPTTSGNYSVEGSTNGCKANQSTTITVNAKPGKPTATVPVIFCQNDASFTLTALPSSGNNITWYNNANLTGGYTTAPTPSTTTAGTTIYYATQTNPATGCTSDSIEIAVIVQPAITNNTITADQTICANSSAAVLNGASGLAGGTGTFGYQWEQSTNGGTTWSVIPSATSATYSPGAISVTTRFRRIVSSGACSNTSPSVTVTVQPQVTNTGISANQDICEGNTPAIITGQSPVGTGPFTYVWERSLNSSSWTPITGATGKDYQPPALSTTTYYRRITTDGPCTGTSNVVMITVKPFADGNITGPAGICQYQTAAVTFNSTAGTAPFDVVLSVKDPSNNTTSITQSVSNGSTINVLPLNSAPGTYTITLTSITNSNGCVKNTGLNNIAIVVTQTPNVVIAPAGPICEGKSATLSVSGATAYTWSATNTAINLSATTGSSVTATPSAAATYPYQVQGTTNGCSATANSSLVVNPKPGKPTVVTPVTYCQLGPASPLQATASGGNTLKWYDNTALTGGVTAAPTPSTANAGTIYYYVSQTNGFGCESDTATTAIIVNPGITDNTISGGETICQGSVPANTINNAGTLTGGTGTYTYQWQSSTDNGTTWNNISGATSAGFTPSSVLNTTTLYRRVVTSGLCGSISNTVTITVLIGLGNYDISASQTVCEGAPVALLDGQATTGTGPFTYTWQQSPDGVNWTDIVSSNTEDYQPPVLTTTTYYRRKVTNGPCTGFSSAVQITVKPLTNGSITAPAAICEYESAAITFTSSTGTAPFTIGLSVTNPGGVVSNMAPQTVNSGGTVNVIPLNSAPGNYTIALTSITSNACTRSTGLNTVTITVKPTPVVAVPAVAPICKADSATLTATGADTYAWAGSGLSANTGATVKASPASTTTYTVVGTTNGCSAQATYALTVNPRPIININVADNDICLNQQGNFSVTSSIDSGSIQNYYWDFDNGNTQVLPGNITTAAPQSYASHRVYITKLYAISDKNCTSVTDTAWITVNPMPTAAFTVPASVCLPNNVATFNNQSSIANGATLSYIWNYGDPASGPLNTSTGTTGAHIYPDSADYIITLSVVSPAGCADQTTRNFNAFFKKPVAKFGVTPDTLCQGIQNLFRDSSFAPGSTIQRRLWLFGDGNSLLDSTNAAKIYTRPGDYNVKLVVQSVQGCTSDTAYKNIKVYLQPVIDAGPSFVVGAGTTVTFNATANSGSLKFRWTSVPSTALVDDSTKLKPSYIATQDAKFILTATGQGNCKAWDSITVKVLLPIAIPNAFSPNGDGINDKWEINNLKDYPNCIIEVYNRYGQPVYRSFGYNRPWDGTVDGKPLPVGTYYYIIDPKNGFSKKTGYVVIVK